MNRVQVHFRARACAAATLLILPLGSELAGAQDMSRTGPRLPPPATQEATIPSAMAHAMPADPDQLVMSSLKAIVLIDDPSKVISHPNATPALQIAIPAINGQTPLLDQLRGHIGKPLYIRTLNEITAALVRTYDQMGRPVVDVIVPEQDVTEGVLQVIVLEGRVGKVEIEGNRYFGAAGIRSRIHSQPGDPIQRAGLLRDLDRLNQNPFREVQLIFDPGAKTGQTDLRFHVDDRVPLRLYGGYENTGDIATGKDRLLTGLNWGNVLGLEHQFNYQFSCSPDTERFIAHGASYLIPWPNGFDTSLSGTWSQTHPDSVDPNFDSHSQNWQIVGRQSFPLPTFHSVEQSLDIGIDFKHSENDFEFGGTRLFPPYEVFQAEIGYHATIPDPIGQTNLSASVFLSPGHLTSENNDAAFSGAREGADAEYAYFLASLDRRDRLPARFALVTHLSAQYAPQSLVPTEQFGVGGHSSVRGYPEQALSGDSGLLFSAQIESMPLSPLKLLGVRKLSDDLRFFVFSDNAVTWNQDANADYPGQAHINSLGVGLHYSISRYLSVEYSYGWRVWDDDDFNSPDHDSAGHSLSIIGSFEF